MPAATPTLSGRPPRDPVAEQMKRSAEAARLDTAEFSERLLALFRIFHPGRPEFASVQNLLAWLHTKQGFDTFTNLQAFADQHSRNTRLTALGFRLGILSKEEIERQQFAVMAAAFPDRSNSRVVHARLKQFEMLLLTLAPKPITKPAHELSPDEFSACIDEITRIYAHDAPQDRQPLPDHALTRAGIYADDEDRY